MPKSNLKHIFIIPTLFLVLLLSIVLDNHIGSVQRQVNREYDRIIDSLQRSIKVMISLDYNLSQLYKQSSGGFYNHNFELDEQAGLCVIRPSNDQSAVMANQDVSVPNSRLDYSIAGSVHLLSNLSTDEFKAGIDFNYIPSQVDKKLLLTLGGPISESLSANFVMQRKDSEGYMLNLYTGERNTQRDELLSRLVVGFEPSDTLSFTLKIEQGNFKTVGRNLEIILDEPTPLLNVTAENPLTGEVATREGISRPGSIAFPWVTEADFSRPAGKASKSTPSISISFSRICLTGASALLSTSKPFVIRQRFRSSSRSCSAKSLGVAVRCVAFAVICPSLRSKA